VTVVGKSIVVKGEFRSSEDVTVDGRIDGPVHCGDFALVIGASGHVIGDIVARDITVFGHASGQLVATEVVDIRAEATVMGHVVSERFILDEAARFQGRVEPQHLEAALRVARFQQRQRDARTPA
jgi:cytoskeletal protein CcmA (bactofilin family)